MRKTAPLFLYCLILGISLTSCASYTDELQKIRSDYLNRHYKKALEALETSDIREEARNKLLYQLEKAMILDRLGETSKSQQLLIDADKTVDQLYKASTLGELASYVYNDSASDYQGEDYEKVAIHTVLASSFLGEGKLQKARVEARAITERLHEINNFYNENKNRYNDDGFARFLSGLIYEAQKEWDSAIIEYEQALNIYQGSYRKHFKTPVPDTLLTSYYRVATIRNRKNVISRLQKDFPSIKWPEVSTDDSFAVVIHEVSTISPKLDGNFVMLWDGKPLRFSFPYIKSRRWHSYSDNGAYLNGTYHSGDLVQDMDAIAEATLEDSKTRYFFKSISRIILKDQLAQKAKKEGGPLAELIVSIAGAATETADTRSWSFLPGSFFITRIKLPKGDHTLRIKTHNRSSDFRKLESSPGTIHFLRDHG